MLTGLAVSINLQRTLEKYAVVVVERSHPIQEVRGSNPAIGNFIELRFPVNCRKHKNKKRPGMAHLKEIRS